LSLTDDTLRVLHLDDRLLVADKPAGLLCVPGRGPDKADCLVARAQALYADALVVHRLDMATSGLVLFARGTETQRALSMAFAERRIHKRYEAIVAGHPGADEGEINLPLAADWPHRPRQQVCHRTGKPSRTLWQLQSHDAQSGTSRLALIPVTGRTHQLRVHLAAVGHPILGDALYASPPWQTLAPRLLLHATSLSWDDDVGHRQFSSPPPF
jgi:tRNA pseudouridine32 synthase/23S rRNA pseudouridine746 synthase